MADDDIQSNSDQLSQSTPMDLQDNYQPQYNQPRSSFDILYSQAQNGSKSQMTNRKRSKPNMTYSEIYVYRF